MSKNRKTTDLAKGLSDYFGSYLPNECGASKNTIDTYSVAFTLLFEFMLKEKAMKADDVQIKDITKALVVEFLRWLENERNASVKTRNNRLSTIKSFFDYLQYREIKHIAQCQDILSIKDKKQEDKEMAYLDINALKAVLSQPDPHTHFGRRDFILLSLLYDCGCRVQELIDMTPADVRFDSTSTVSIRGKGGKVRLVPLSTNQASNLKKYMTEQGLLRNENLSKPLFPNRQGNRMTRMGIRRIVKKHVEGAKSTQPDLNISPKITCHSFRHTKAMHMMDADVDIVSIRDFLGHSSVTTTQIYAKVSMEKKRKAVGKLSPDIVGENEASWNKDSELMEYLTSLRRKHSDVM